MYKVHELAESLISRIIGDPVVQAIKSDAACVG